jgi:hypothetical protein
MAKNPKDNAQRYGLSADVAADMEAEEGPPSLGAQQGADRTVIPEHTGHTGHGPKTRARTKDIINRQP